MDNNISSVGECRLLSAKVGGDVHINGAFFALPKDSESAFSVTADKIKVSGSMRFHKCNILGETRLMGANIEGDLDFSDSSFVSDGKQARESYRQSVSSSENSITPFDGIDTDWTTPVSCEYLTVGRKFRWIDIGSADKVELNLFHAKIKSIVDDENSWPSKGHLVLDGLHYDTIAIGPRDSLLRINWLERQRSVEKVDIDSYIPQPYEQLAKCLRSMGYDREAIKVAIAKQERRRKFASLDLWSRIAATLLKWVIGYGYRPYLALGWMTLTILLGWLVSLKADQLQIMVPVSNLKNINDFSFNPLLYSIDTLIPVVDLSQAKYWIPISSSSSSAMLSVLICIYYRMHILLGWLLSTLALVGFTGLIRKD